MLHGPVVAGLLKDIRTHARGDGNGADSLKAGQRVDSGAGDHMSASDSEPLLGTETTGSACPGWRLRSTWTEGRGGAQSKDWAEGV